MTKTASIIRNLRNGNRLTAKQISNYWGAANPAGHIHYARSLGSDICIGEFINSKGVSRNKYYIPYNYSY
jgi:hypothetical protein